MKEWFQFVYDIFMLCPWFWIVCLIIAIASEHGIRINKRKDIELAIRASKED